MKKSKKRSRRSLKNKTKKYKRGKTKMGGHEHEDLPHYHLYIRSPRGTTYEIPARFANTNLERNVDAATIADIKEYVESEGVNRDKAGIQKPYTLFWKGKKLEDSNVKLRKIVVEGEKLPLYRGNTKEPIVVILNEDIGDPVWFEAHDIDWRDPNTPR